MSMLNLHINRSGRNLSRTNRLKLELAKRKVGGLARGRPSPRAASPRGSSATAGRSPRGHAVAEGAMMAAFGGARPTRFYNQCSRHRARGERPQRTSPLPRAIRADLPPSESRTLWWVLIVVATEV
jgi:hypothetical protein